jgi:LacI family transcriptional regulator
MANMKKASLADVAKSLGVSKTLVSLVLNDRGNENGISQETQKKVKIKARELNYRPNLFARGLRMGKSNTIGLVVADISNSFYAKLCRAVEDGTTKHKYNLMICSSDEDSEKEEELIEMLIDRQVDGLIISTTQKNTRSIQRLKKQGFPFVLVDRRMAKIETDSVTVDNRAGAYDAVKHLLEMGNKKIGVLSLTPAHLSTIQERVQGYKDALKDHGIRYEKSLVKEVPFGDLKAGVRKEIKALMSAPSKVSALFAVNNNLAVACLECLNEMNIKVPQDVALLSFDDIEAFTLSYPPVTAVAQPIQAMGDRAVEILFKRIADGPEAPAMQDVLNTELVVRRSCGSFIHQM